MTRLSVTIFTKLTTSTNQTCCGRTLRYVMYRIMFLIMYLIIGPLKRVRRSQHVTNVQIGLHIVFYGILLAVFHEREYFGYRRRLERLYSLLCRCGGGRQQTRDNNVVAMRTINLQNAGEGHLEAPVDPDVLKESALVDQEASHLMDSVHEQINSKRYPLYWFNLLNSRVILVVKPLYSHSLYRAPARTLQ